MVAALKCLDGPLAGELIPLESDRFLIGRETDCNLRPDNELISRHHCVLRRDAYGLRVRDLGSKNGTFVNGEKTRGDVVLCDGDELRVGDMAFHIVFDVGSRSGDTSSELPDQAQDQALRQTAVLDGNTLSRSLLATDSAKEETPPLTPATPEDKTDGSSQ